MGSTPRSGTAVLGANGPPVPEAPGGRGVGGAAVAGGGIADSRTGEFTVHLRTTEKADAREAAALGADRGGAVVRYLPAVTAGELGRAFGEFAMEPERWRSTSQSDLPRSDRS